MTLPRKGPSIIDSDNEIESMLPPAFPLTFPLGLSYISLSAT